MNKSKLLLTGALAAAFSSGGAFAADMPVKAAPASASFSWEGFYAGAQGGYGWAKNDYATVPPFTAFGIGWDSHGGFGGAVAGYNHQLGNLVLGVQSEINAADIDGATTDPTFGNRFHSNLKWFGSIDGRLGFVLNQSLLYAIGGYAYGDVRHDVSALGGVTNFKETYNGWNAGAGIEYAATRNWTVRAEYRYYDFGSETFATAFPVAAHEHRLTMNTARIGLVYKFGN